MAQSKTSLKDTTAVVPCPTCLHFYVSEWEGATGTFHETGRRQVTSVEHSHSTNYIERPWPNHLLGHPPCNKKREKLCYYIFMNKELDKDLGRSGLDPKKIAMVVAYTNPNSPTFGNSVRSGISAGYSPSYARMIGTNQPDWFKTYCRRGSLLEKSEVVLDKYLTVDTEDTGVMKIQQDTAKFVSSTLGKNEYSTRREVTGKDGEKLYSSDVKKEVESVLNDFLGRADTKVLHVVKAKEIESGK